ncbi:NADH dehydrogenase [ubiquinone] 1 alpha subcomplex assembly factor 2 isoform X5 [Cuculus canorus]|uniref:NADH dehydrogenase [ubiquinone] 1 alpha subcomplex assembly factor 2 isoform X5 n=1 Tax=Cuculus canorus TaxID=55661 RepID=UPI0023AAE259|nr:NADH dehydrogenase [ubiquinone] 1 alpha subcomplex assembly factor 2 isoform X5 [Cuculus canorus]
MGLSSNFCKEETVRGWLYAVAFCTTKYLSEGCLHCKDCRISRGEIQKERKGIKDSRCSEKIPLKGEAIETKKSRRELKTQAHKNQALSKRTGQIIPERRFVEAINRQPYQYEMGDFPTEWEAWIRKKRKDPPTIEKKKNFMESERLLGVMVHSELQDYWYLQFHKRLFPSILGAVIHFQHGLSSRLQGLKCRCLSASAEEYQDTGLSYYSALSALQLPRL